MGQLFADAARAYLSAGINNTDTTISIAAGGALFPVANGTDWFKAVLQDANGIEIVYVTAHTSASTSFTVTRGQEGTTARSFAAGSVFGLRVTAADTAAFAGKVDKVAGKGLSTEDYTTAEKSKLAGVEAGAQVNTVTSVAGKTGAVTLAKADVGLGNVDNTSDANKPVSTAAQAALNLKANLASPTFTGTVGGITKAMVGLANVDNTSDLAKPISTATQTALDGKANTSHTHTAATTVADGFISAADKAKLDGVAVAATANATDAQLRDRSTHTGTQAISTVTGLQTALDAKQPLDADLTAIAELAGTSGLLKKTAANTWVLDTATYLTGITSSQVTTALGFTPYNATNPAGYLTSSGSITGSAATLTTGRTIAMTGDVTYTSGSFNGSANVTGTATLANSGVTAGTYTKVTVDAKGRVTVGASLASADVTTALGFTPYSSANPSGYTSNTGTVTSVSGGGTVSGLTLTGTVTGSGSLTLGGTLALTSGQVTTALGFTPGVGDVTLAGAQTLTNKVITGIKETQVAMPANNIDLAGGNYFTKTITAATTLTVSNVPSTGTATSFILNLTNGGSGTITWWSGVKWAGGTAPTLTAAGRDVLGFFTHDGGTTWTGLVLGKDVK